MNPYIHAFKGVRCNIKHYTMENTIRYAVAYKDGTCIFDVSGGSPEIVGNKHLCVAIPQAQDASDTYEALEGAISEVVGQDVKLHFTRNEATRWETV